MQKYTITEVRKMLGITRSTMDRILRENLIGTITFARRRYITHDQYQKYLEDSITPAQPRGKAPLSFIEKINMALSSMGENGLSEREMKLCIALGEVLKK